LIPIPAAAPLVPVVAPPPPPPAFDDRVVPHWAGMIPLHVIRRFMWVTRGRRMDANTEFLPMSAARWPIIGLGRHAGVLHPGNVRLFFASLPFGFAGAMYLYGKVLGTNSKWSIVTILRALWRIIWSSLCLYILNYVQRKIREIALGKRAVDIHEAWNEGLVVHLVEIQSNPQPVPLRDVRPSEHQANALLSQGHTAIGIYEQIEVSPWRLGFLHRDHITNHVFDLSAWVNAITYVVDDNPLRTSIFTADAYNRHRSTNIDAFDPERDDAQQLAMILCARAYQARSNMAEQGMSFK